MKVGFVPGLDVVWHSIPARPHGDDFVPLQSFRFAGTVTLARRAVSVFASAQENLFAVIIH